MLKMYDRCESFECLIWKYEFKSHESLNILIDNLFLWKTLNISQSIKDMTKKDKRIPLMLSLVMFEWCLMIYVEDCERSLRRRPCCTEYEPPHCSCRTNFFLLLLLASECPRSPLPLLLPCHPNGYFRSPGPIRFICQIRKMHSWILRRGPRKARVDQEVILHFLSFESLTYLKWNFSDSLPKLSFKVTGSACTVTLLWTEATTFQLALAA